MRFGIAVMIFIVTDILIGLVSALATHQFKSKIMRQGMWHKIGELAALALLYEADILLPWLGMSVNVPVIPIGCTYLIIMEVGSIWENIMRLNPDLAALKKRLEDER